MTSMKRIQTFAAGSIVVGIVVLALKYTAYVLTGSVALLSDAIESIVNVATAVVALLAVRWSAMPADAGHPYGHHKAEYFSAVIEGVLIVIAALAILREAYFGYLAPKSLDAPWQGLAVNGLASLVNAVWSWVLNPQGRRLQSPALMADGHHLSTDVMSSVGVLAGVALAAVTGWRMLDPALAAAVALYILWSGWRLMKDSVGGLMDEAVVPRPTRAAGIRLVSIPTRASSVCKRTLAMSPSRTSESRHCSSWQAMLSMLQGPKANGSELLALAEPRTPPPGSWTWGGGSTPTPPAPVCRKLRFGRIDDAVRRPWRATRCVRFAEPGGRPAHRGPMTGAFSPYCNSEHTLAASNADASRRARRCGPRTHDGSFRSTARQTNSATARPLQWVCRHCPIIQYPPSGRPRL
jgi:cation diffusion facilitator family transporter